jgi:hypothetical protein
MNKKKSSVQPLYIAVIIGKGTTSGVELVLSGRLEGDWASYVGTDMNQVVKRAREAQVEWEASGEYGPYRILVGTLESVVEFPVKYNLVKMEVYKEKA